MNPFKKAFVLFSFTALFSSCGKSIYSSISSDNGDAALKEDAILALDHDDYSKAEAKLSILWKKDKANEIAQLYAITMLGKGNFSVFEIIKNALQLSASSTPNGTEIMNQMATKSEELFGGAITVERQAYAKQALDILQAADNQSGSGLIFQKCLTAGIYAVPLLQMMTQVQNKLNEIKSLSENADFCNTARAETVGNSLTSLISDAGTMADSLSSIQDTLNTCLPADATQNVNAISGTINNILAKADKGCDILLDQINTIGEVPLPLCLNNYIKTTTTGAQAGDKKISGCELFLHCASGDCFTTN